MKNGLIHGSQIYVPDNPSFGPNARLFYPWKIDKRGWKPSAVYMTTSHAGKIECYKKLTRVPKTIVRNAPVYIEVTFLGMKKVMFLLIQADGGFSSQYANLNNDRKFVLSYRGFNGRTVVYGMDAVLAEVSVLFYVFSGNVPSPLLSYMSAGYIASPLRRVACTADFPRFLSAAVLPNS